MGRKSLDNLPGLFLAEVSTILMDCSGWKCRQPAGFVPAQSLKLTSGVTLVHLPTRSGHRSIMPHEASKV